MRATLSLLLCVVGCSGSSSPSEAKPEPVDAGPPTVSAQDCTTRCAAKAQACGAPAAQAGTICGSICNTAITEAQAACLEAKTCSDLVAAAGQGGTISTICPGPEADPSTTAPSSVPAELTIATAIPANYVVDHTSEGTMRSSLFNVGGRPLFVPAPELGHLPELTKRSEVTVVSPPRNGCDSPINVTISATQLSVSTSGVDVLPETKCADFIDAIATRGATFTLTKVPWPGTTETSTVTIVLKRLSKS